MANDITQQSGHPYPATMIESSREEPRSPGLFRYAAPSLSPTHTIDDSNQAKSQNSVVPPADQVAPTARIKFADLLPTIPILIEDIRNEVELATVPPEIQEQSSYICTGQDGGSQPHFALDKESFLKRGVCKECILASFDANTKQNKNPSKESDKTFEQLITEINKLEQGSRDNLLSILSNEHVTTGVDLKERLRGMGMGFHSENKTRKVHQFEHNSILSYYAFGLKVLTLVYDPAKNDLSMVGAPEVKSQIAEASEKMKNQTGKNPLEAGTNLLKKVFKNTVQIPAISLDMRKNASLVWNNTFSKRKAQELNEDEDKKGKHSSDKTKKSKKSKSASENIPSIPLTPATTACPPPITTSTNQAPFLPQSPLQTKTTAPPTKPFSTVPSSPPKDLIDFNKVMDSVSHVIPVIDNFEGEIVGIDATRSRDYKSCDQCGSDGDILKIQANGVYFCSSQMCKKEVNTKDNVFLVVKVKVGPGTASAGEEVLVELKEDDIQAFLSKEKPSVSDMFGKTIGPAWFQKDGDLWKQFASC